jgi:hypothetical protein
MKPNVRKLSVPHPGGGVKNFLVRFDGDVSEDELRKLLLPEIDRVYLTGGHPEPEASVFVLNGKHGIMLRQLDGKDPRGNAVVEVEGEAQTHVPEFGASILAFVCSPDRLEAVLGDLEENFHRIALKRGVSAARRWYYYQIVRSVLAFSFGLLRTGLAITEILRKLGL